MHPFLVSVAVFQIYHQLTHIINLSISQGIFPDSTKIVKVVPIFKQDARLSCDNYNYWPISILPTLSKIFEKCIFNQFTSYLSNEDIPTRSNMAFALTVLLLIVWNDLIEEITATLDKGDYAVSLFLDLSKAFDTVNHQILLKQVNIL